MSQPGHTPLVPRNEPLNLDLRGKPADPTAEFMRDSIEETKWHNPTDRPVKVELFIGTPEARGPKAPPRTHFERHGVKIYVWHPGETKSLDASLAQAIQRTECQETECLHRKYACTDPDHQHVIVGGAAPMLVNLGMQKRPILHPSLDDVAWREQQAKMLEFEAYQRRKQAEIDAAKAKAEQDLIDKELQARAKQDAEAAAVAAKHAPKKTDADEWARLEAETAPTTTKKK